MVWWVIFLEYTMNEGVVWGPLLVGFFTFFKKKEKPIENQPKGLSKSKCSFFR
jgi:hypothetical protein